MTRKVYCVEVIFALHVQKISNIKVVDATFTAAQIDRPAAIGITQSFAPAPDDLRIFVTAISQVAAGRCLAAAPAVHK